MIEKTLKFIDDNPELTIVSFCEDIAAELIEIRTAKGWASYEAANKLNVSENQLLQMERADVSIATKDYLRLILKYKECV